MRILITGGLGFVGSHLTDALLKQNNEILVLTKSFRKKSNLLNKNSKLKIKKIDITNFKKLEKIIDEFKPSLIIHLAGNTSHSKSFENPLKDIDSNAKSTLFILEKIRKSSFSCRFILGSTFIVIGKPEMLPINEKSPCNPTTIYGTNRLTSEHYCKIYTKMYNLKTNIFRITNSYGPREQIVANKNAINYLIYRAHKGKNVTIFEKGKFYRDLIYVDDVINGIKTIIRKGKAGELYWISSNKKTWFYQFGDLLKHITKAEIKYPQTPKYTKKVDVGNFVVDNSKLKKLGWKPKISIDEGIQKTIRYFESQRL